MPLSQDEALVLTAAVSVEAGDAAPSRSPWATATPRSSLGATGTAHLVDAAGDPATVLNAMKRAGTIDEAQLATMNLASDAQHPAILKDQSNGK